MSSPSIAYDAHSFIINGRRQFLTSGSIHYFRVPHELWRDRLEKAKACGLNTVQTYVAWNWHEPADGVFDFSGDRDLEGFLSLCEDLGLYVVARPGPYICAEWDFGGFPAWLLTKRGIAIRHYDPVYLKHVDRWFEQLIPVIARHQVSRGGTVILVQIENELGNVVPESGDAAAYMDHLRSLVHRLGIDVPLVTCAGSAEGAIEVINSHEPAECFPRFRERQPDVPLHCTEFWSAWYQTWHRKRAWVNKTPEHLAYHTWRVIAEGGAGYNYYMWHGGTNFGYTTMYLQTTSYDFDAPLSEAGAVSRRGLLTIPIAHFARSFNAILADSDATVTRNGDGTELWERKNEHGRLLFLKNPTDRTITSEPIVCDGISLGRVQVGPKSVRPIIAGAEVVSGVRIYTGSLVHGVYGSGNRSIIVLIGGKGEKASCSAVVDGRTATASGTVRAGHAQAIGTISSAKKTVQIVLAHDSYLGRVWQVGDRVVIGANYAHVLDEGAALLLRDAHTAVTAAWVVSKSGLEPVGARQARLPRPPSLAVWKARRGDGDAMPDADLAGWTGSFRPVARDLVGDHFGYGWYRAIYRSREPRRATLHIEALSDRALVFLNGKHLHTTLEPIEDRRFQPSVTAETDLAEGANTLAVLVDNLGHVKGDWQIDEIRHRDARTMRDDLKGILGRVWVDHDEVLVWHMRAGLVGEREQWFAPGAQKGWRRLSATDRCPLTWFRSTFALSKDELAGLEYRPLRVRVTGLSKGCLWVNGHHLGRYWNVNDHSDYYIPPCWLAAENTLVIVEETEATPEHVSLVWDEVAAMADVARVG